MKQAGIRRRWIVLGFVLAVVLLSGGIWRYGYVKALDQLAQQGRADLALASDRLMAQLQRYQELAVLLSDHPELDAVLAGDRLLEAKTLLLSAADKTAALDVMFVDLSGRVLVAAHGLAGPDMAASPAFARALQGALGTDHGLKPPFDQRSYTLAAPTFGADGRVRGVLMVAVDIENVEWDWSASNPTVFFTDAGGEIFITNRSELLFWQRQGGLPGLVPPIGDPLPFVIRQIGRHEVWTMDWGPYLPKRALHLTQPLPVIGMTGEGLIDVTPARRLAALQAAAVAAICLAFGALLFMATERRRTLAQTNAILESRVIRRTQALSDANAQLRREITERQEAEAALKQAQADLIQAGKLSALGQMSAGISHELNQPLMAIQSFADNGAQFLERGKPDRAADNLGRIADMARRMGRIIKNLRAFARQESEPSARVDVGAVLTSALDLTGPRLRQAGVTLEYAPLAHPVWVRGGEVRLGQVFVNLISNAVDAMAASDQRRLMITIDPTPHPTVTLRDTGPGIDTPDKMFEPFYSTKTVTADEGMGLGLSISYGIVQSFGGDIRGANAPDGGAVFTVTLEPWAQDLAA